MTAMPRFALLAAGLIGAGGIALSAMAAHGADPHLIGTAATICLAQAPALLGIVAGYEKVRLAGLATLLIALGTALFAGDLLFRSAYAHGLFPMSAPTGGTMMILGWLALAVSALFPSRSSE